MKENSKSNLDKKLKIKKPKVKKDDCQTLEQIQITQTLLKDELLSQNSTRSRYI